MLKNLGLIPRRADLSRAAFRDHYETRHAPLALRYLRTLRRYVRNHVVDARPADPPFDALSEFWFDNEADVKRVIDFLGSPAGEVLREDEARFMDRSRVAIMRVEETLLFGPARATEDGVVSKQALLLSRAAGAGADAFRADVERLCAELLRPRATGFGRLYLDLPIARADAKLAFDALITAWPDDPGRALFGELPELSNVAGSTHLWFESHETPPQLLRD
jgi:uncharacterized protein (TIGR02118 family)